MSTILLHIALNIFYAVVGIAGGLVLGLLMKDWLHKSKRGRAAAFALLAFTGIFQIPPRPPTTIEEESDDKTGDPPEPG